MRISDWSSDVCSSDLLTSTTDIGRNIELSTALIREAHAAGARVVGLPEIVNLCQRRRRPAMEAAQPEDREPSLAAYKALAAELEIWLLVGSLVVKLTDDERLANRSYLIDDRGSVVASYDKIHMFDVDLAGGESYRDSNTFRPGERAVVAETRSEEHTSELQSLMRISYAVICLKKKKRHQHNHHT